MSDNLTDDKETEIIKCVMSCNYEWSEKVKPPGKLYKGLIVHPDEYKMFKQLERQAKRNSRATKE